MALRSRLVSVLAVLALSAAARAAQPAIGGAQAVPYPEAVARSRAAAEAVLARSGTETCLRGKLTNALLTLSASCNAASQATGLCELANRAASTLDWPVSFMEATARAVLGQS